MADQTARLEAATVRAEVGSSILYRFSNDGVAEDPIPTASGDITNLKKVILEIQTEGANKISFATQIYPTTAAGIAATTSGAIFLVRSSDPDEIYAVYSNNAGTAVDTGKRALSATAIQTATDSATAAAAAAQTAANTATARVAGFHSPSASDPTTRDDGSALQIGDTYFNTTSQSTRVYSNTGWVAQALDAAYLSANAGASRVGKTGGGTVQDFIDAATTSLAGKEPAIAAGPTVGTFWANDKTFKAVTKGNVGLGNVDNTADVDKPVSGPQQTAIDAVAALARTVFAVSSVAALRTNNATGVFTVVTRGYYASGGLGAGVYDSVPGDTTTADDGGLNIVNAVGVRLRLRTADGVSICHFGARGTWNGSTGGDDTTAIQAAMDCGVRRVWIPVIPSGFAFQTTAPINVSKSVSVMGYGVETQLSIGTLQNVRGAGSWVHLNHSGIGFNIDRVAAGFQGVEFEKMGTLRSHTVPSSGTFVPTVYDYDFSVDDCADFKMIDVCTLNPYRALLIKNGQQGRVWIERLYGQPIFEGIQVLLSYDCVRLNNIQFWPYWSFHASVWAYHKLNTVGLKTFRVDGLFINQYFSIFHRIGWQVSGDTNGTANKSKCVGMFFDNCAYGYFVDTNARGHTCSIVNMSIQMDPAVVDTSAKPVFVVPDSCDIDIVDLSVTVPIAEAIRVSGPYCRVGLHNPKVYDWAKGGTTIAAMICDDVNSVIVVTGRKIFDLGGTNIIYAGSGKIVSSIATGTTSATTNASGDIVVTHSGRATPNKNTIQIKSVASLTWVVTAATSSTFTVRIFNPVTGAGLASTPVSFDWQCEMV